MKKYLFYLLLLFLGTSCAPMRYYQVLNVKPAIDIAANSDNKSISIENGNPVYQDDNCKIFYNFWKNGGEFGFKVYNKTNKPLYLHLDKSYYSVNGKAYNYFGNRVFTYSSGQINNNISSFSYLGLGFNSQIMGTSSSVSIAESKIINIPPETWKEISGYKITDTLYRDCELYRYPTNKEIKSETYTETNSPFTFKNYITYSVGEERTFIIQTKFYVSEIKNLPENQFIFYKQEKFCNQYEMSSKGHLKEYSPDKFYLNYIKYGYMKH
jgi:hypothetical protein